MEILGQQWWIQAIGLTISLGGLYFVVTGIQMMAAEYKPLFEAMLQSKGGSNSR